MHCYKLSDWLVYLENVVLVGRVRQSPHVDRVLPPRPATKPHPVPVAAPIAVALRPPTKPSAKTIIAIVVIVA